MKVAILGCGPAGLLAAHAVEQAGHQPVVFSRKQKSQMPGAQYVHERIEGATNYHPDAFINYVKLGTREGYAAKVYGSPDAPCSWDAFPTGIVEGWDMGWTYERLWERFGGSVLNHDVDHDLLACVQQNFDKVISSVPARLLCYGDCEFNSARIWIAPRHRYVCQEIGDPCIVYDGREEFDHYRTSLINGHGYTEYPHGAARFAMVGFGAQSGIKPLGTNCRCRPNIMRVGRFGQWRKGVLVHHAYREVLDALQ